jgi:hypothetical protein
MSVIIQLYFQIVKENSYMFRPFSGWAIIRLRLNIGENSYTTMWTSRMRERDLVLQCLGRCVAIYTRCGICDGYDFVVSSVVLNHTTGMMAPKTRPVLYCDWSTTQNTVPFFPVHVHAPSHGILTTLTNHQLHFLPFHLQHSENQHQLRRPIIF